MFPQDNTQFNVFPSLYIAMTPTESPSLLPAPSHVVLIDEGDVSFNVNLTCTVRESGRFKWTWTDPSGDPPSAVTYSNVTRTSTALFTRISASNNSLTFSCQASYDTEMAFNFPIEVSQSITVMLTDNGGLHIYVCFTNINHCIADTLVGSEITTDFTSEEPTMSLSTNPTNLKGKLFTSRRFYSSIVSMYYDFELCISYIQHR